MSYFLLYHPKTRPTGRALAKMMGIPCGTVYSRKFEGMDVIRWGNIRDVPATTERDGRGVLRTEINHQRAVTLAGSKLRSLLAWKEHGLITPHVWRYGQRREDGHRMSEDFISDDGLVEKPFFGRAFRHSRGTDISVFDVGFSMVGHNRPDYYIEYIEPRKEYRIHVMKGEIIRAQKKFFGEELFQRLTEGATEEEKERFRRFSGFVRNNETGWRMYDVNNIEKVPVDVLDMAKKCMLVIGLDFGAVDIVFTKNDTRSRAFPLEVNTAPGLRDDNLELYASNLSRIIQ
jgi:hypothetical protein